MIIDTTQGDRKPSTPAPEGAHLARLLHIVDLGYQEDTWQGETNIRRKVRLTFELVCEPMEDGRNFVVGKDFTFSFGDKSKLKPTLEALNGGKKLGVKFDLASLLGAPCTVQVSHQVSSEGRTYAKLTGVLAAMKGIPVPELQNEPLLYDTNAPDPDVLAKLPKFVQETIAKQVRKNEVPF